MDVLHVEGHVDPFKVPGLTLRFVCGSLCCFIIKAFGGTIFVRVMALFD